MGRMKRREIGGGWGGGGEEEKISLILKFKKFFKSVSVRSNHNKKICCKNDYGRISCSKKKKKTFSFSSKNMVYSLNRKTN